MTITLAQLRYFCELADAGTFGRAASRLHMSQPPLSRQIAALEAELKTELCVRGAKGIALTPAGVQFLADARDVLRQMARARQNVAAARAGEIGRLSIGFTMCAAYSVVPPLMRRYRAAFPQVRLEVREMMPVVLDQALRGGEVDLGISFPDAFSTGMASKLLLREPLNVVLPQTHPLARARRVKVQELKADSFVIVPRNQAPLLHDAVVRRCIAAGFTPQIGLEVYLQQTIVNLVAEDLGVAFVPASMQRAQVKGAVFRRMDDPPEVDQVALWQPENANPCLKGFLAICDGVGGDMADIPAP